MPTAANTEPPAVFIPAAEATFIQPMMTRNSSSLEKEKSGDL